MTEGASGGRGQREENDDDQPPQGASQGSKGGWTPQALKKAAADRLRARGDLMSAAQRGIEWIFRGEEDRSLATAGTSFSRLAALYEELGADAEMHGLSLAGSIHVRVGPSERELSEAKPTARGVQEVPPTLVASEVLTDLVEATHQNAEAIKPRALATGAGTASAYRSLLRHVADSGLELELASKDRFVPLEPDDAEIAAETLETAGEEESFRVSVTGTLSMADADKLVFRLNFADDVPRPDVLRNWKRGSITGSYTPQMKETLRKKGFWGQEVIASLEVTRNRRGTTAKPARPTVKLRQVRRRFGRR